MKLFEVNFNELLVECEEIDFSLIQSICILRVDHLKSIQQNYTIYIHFVNIVIHLIQRILDE